MDNDKGPFNVKSTFEIEVPATDVKADFRPYSAQLTYDRRDFVNKSESPISGDDAENGYQIHSAPWAGDFEKPGCATNGDGCGGSPRKRYPSCRENISASLLIGAWRALALAGAFGNCAARIHCCSMI
ncbi:MAG: hypothetical protein H6970_00970 [Gammaproteobacteria bacterium]|nr:hypothetical protein [Gammaproteobacteria bacterium]MCP5423629.1 hypothetical protein [Gammaproteobacteria bacterium]